MLDLLNMEITEEGNHIKVSQADYISKLMDTYAPDGKPLCRYGSSYPFKSHPPSREPAATDLPQILLNATTGQEASDVEPDLLRSYQSLVGALSIEHECQH